MGARNLNAKLPQDEDNSAIQALAPGESVNCNVAVGSGRFVLPTGAQVLLLSFSVDAYVRFGDNTVVAATTGGSILFPAGAQVFVVPDNATDLAVISSDGSTTGLGTMTLLE